MPEMSGKVTALSVGQTPKGQMQAKYAAVGCDDCTIRILSIELDSPLEARSVQALTSVPTSIEVVEQIDPTSGTSVNYVHIGLQSGLYLRAVIDEVTGELGEVRTKFLGARPTRIFPVEVNRQDEKETCILACSTRPWLGYNHPLTRLYTLAPLVTDPLDAARPFVSEHINGMCGIQGSTLRIFGQPSTAGRLNSEEVHLNYTPRAMARSPWYPIWYVAQSDGNTLSKATKQGLLANAKANGMSDGDSNGDSNGTADIKEEDMETDNEETKKKKQKEKEELARHLGLSRGNGHWASCISAVDPFYSKSITSNIEFGENEAALCVAAVPFESRSWEVFVAVGTGQHLQPGTGVQSRGFVHIYRLTDEGRTMEEVHKVSLIPIRRIKRSKIFANTHARPRSTHRYTHCIRSTGG